MRVAQTPPGLPPLPQVPNGGKGELETDISFVAPDTIGLRLGSIPANFDSSSEGRSGEYAFPTDEREAENRYGRSREVWVAYPQFDTQGAVKTHTVTETLVARPESGIEGKIMASTVGVLVGGFAGLVVGEALGFNPFITAGVGAAAVGSAGFGLAAHHASKNRVRLEWQETTLTQKELVGWRLSTSTNYKEECYGFGKNKRCQTVIDDYSHYHTPIFDETPVHTYHRPVVVHYREGSEEVES